MLHANVGWRAAKFEKDGKINMILAMQQLTDYDSWMDEDFKKEDLRLMKIGEKEFNEAFFGRLRK